MSRKQAAAIALVSITLLLSGIATTVQASPDDLHIWGGPGFEYGAGGRDLQGNYYVVGVTTSFHPTRQQVLLMKYSPERVLLWSRVWDWDGGTPQEIGLGPVMPNGDMLVSGFSDTDLLVARFDSDGNFDWARTWDSGSQAVDYVDAVAFGPGGEVYAAGGTSSPVGALVVKFEANGDFDWARTWQRNQAFANDSCNALAVDSLGNAFCAGNTQDDQARTEALLLKFDSGGGLSWARSWRNLDANAVKDDAFGVAVDGGGNPVFSGSTDLGSPVPDKNAMIVRFLENGDRDWARVWGAGTPVTDDGTGSVSVDAGGNIYAGTTQSPSDGLGNALLLKFDVAGNLLHSKSWGGGTDKYYAFVSYDASDWFQLFVSGGMDDSGGVLRNVHRTLEIPNDSVVTPIGTLGTPVNPGIAQTFTEVTAVGCASPPCGSVDTMLLRLTRVCVNVGLDPIVAELSLEKGDCGAPTPVASRTVEVVRGDLDQVGASGGSVDLGFIECVGDAIDTDRVEDLSDTRGLGSKGYYYLARIPALEPFDFGYSFHGDPRDIWSSDPVCP